MITKKRYLELKKRRRELHFALARSKASVRYFLREKELSDTAGNRYNYHEFLSINRRLKKEYNLITELINTSKILYKIYQNILAEKATENHIKEHYEILLNESGDKTSHEDHVRIHHEMGGFS